MAATDEARHKKIYSYVVNVQVLHKSATHVEVGEQGKLYYNLSVSATISTMSCALHYFENYEQYYRKPATILASIRS